MSSQTKRAPISDSLPPLIFGCATFNVQYNKDPFAMDSKGLVEQALTRGVRAFDTSPYYGPSEALLGKALQSEEISRKWPRESYHILTKCGRLSADEFDYSPEWVRKSVARSLTRLQTSYLDVVYCHDCEYVSSDEVLGAVKELRKIRDEEGSVKYVGISGYPISVLANLAERILRETGEPVDIVQSYAHCTVQNTTLATIGVEKFSALGVSVVTNASPMGMGLIRRTGPYTGGGDWHPSPMELRKAIKRASDFCDEHNETIEVVTIRYSIEHWLKAGSNVGTYGDPVPRDGNRAVSSGNTKSKRRGVNVFGISNSAELSSMMDVWQSILAGADKVPTKEGHESSVNRRKEVESLAEGIKEKLGEYYDYSWVSPPSGFVNARYSTEASTRKGPRLGEYVEDPQSAKD